MIPVQEQLGMTNSKVRKLHKLAMLLPEALYALFVQLEAYMEACDKLICVSITGDEEEARNFKKSAALEDENDDSDSDLEDLIQQRRSSRRVSRTDRHDDERKALLQKHPLSVELLVKLKKCKQFERNLAICLIYFIFSDKDTITLKFSYLPKLQVVTVFSSVSLDQVLESKYAG